MTDTRLLVSSVIRVTQPGECSGYLRLISMKEQRVLATWPIPESKYSPYDLNPRGGLRGGRGISGDDERIVVAMTDRVYVFDRAWKQVGELTHPAFGEVHDIHVEPDGVWVTASASDMLVKLGWEGKELRTWSWRNDPILARELQLEDALRSEQSPDYRDPRQLPPFYDFVHLNSVAPTPEGLLLSFGFVPSQLARRLQRLFSLPGTLLKTVGIGSAKAKSSRRFALRFMTTGFTTTTWAAVLVPDQGPARILARIDGIMRPNHNLIRQGDALVFNDTHGNQLVRQALDGSWKQQMKIPGDPPFVRGLAEMGDNRFIVGSQRPATLYEVDFNTPRCKPLVELSTHYHECVYGIHVVPDGFGDPPAQLWEPASGRS